MQRLRPLVLALALAGVVPLAVTAGARPNGAVDDEASLLENSPTETRPFALPAGAVLESDIAYGDNPRQRLDVYRPAGAHGAPVVVMVHGGAWMRGSKRVWRVVKNKVEHWVAKGYVFVSVDYRMLPEADPVAQADDVARALAYVESHAAGWGGDRARVVLMGHSAGAHLVALLAADPAIAARAGATPWLATVALDSGAMDVVKIMGRRHLGLYDRVFRQDPGYWREASPTLRIRGKPATPVLAVCSSRRRDSCPQAQAYVARATEFGGRAEVMPVDLNHAEVNDYLGLAGPYTSGVDAFLRAQGLP